MHCWEERKGGIAVGVRPVLTGDIPELRTVSDSVTAFDEELHQLLDDLACTMQAYGGIGLAAPQIGRPLRVFVTDIGEGVLEFVNPELDKSEETQDSVESCLSLPGLTLKVKRPASVNIRAQDRHGTPFQLQATGLLARVICHEADHLDGVLFTDHLSDEDVFQQMWMTIEASLQEDLDASEPGSPLVHSDAVQAARWEEIRFAADMLADASWKWTLAVELLKDHADLLNADDFAALQAADAHLQAISDHWDKVTESTPEHGDAPRSDGLNADS
jgi:peptide deformylase